MAPERAPLLGLRGAVLLALVLSGLWAFAYLELSLHDLIPGPGGLEVARKFFSRALSPAMHSEAAFVPPGTPPLLQHALLAAWQTVLFAGTAMGIALGLGLGLGFLSSTAWWAGQMRGGRSGTSRFLRRTLAPAVYGSTRVLITLMRSVHEILWAVLFLSALGRSNLAAVFAIAIPFGGTLAKIFSEIVDETPRDASQALQAAGAGAGQVFFIGLLPRAAPDMIAYSFYRFECALRASAILGFFGFPTLGLYIRQSFRSTNYGEVWTYLYVLFAMIILFDLWSGAVRTRLVSR